MMDVAAAEELRLCHAATAVEASLAAPALGARATNAEAFQRCLWRHRDAIIRLIEDHELVDQLVGEMRAALQPFGRCAEILAPGQNPVLISIPSMADGGRSFIQLRPADFRRAAVLAGQR